MTSRCVFGNNQLSKSMLSLLSACLVIWLVVGGLYIYNSTSKPKTATAAQTFEANSNLATERIKAGVYQLSVTQPFTFLGLAQHAEVTYRISKSVDGGSWVAVRSVEINGAKSIIGADAFRTKTDAVSYISNTGRFIDYGKNSSIRALLK